MFERTAALTKLLDTDNSQKTREGCFRDKLIKDLPSDFWDKVHENRKENRRKEFDYREKGQNNSNSNSTLSLHITAYENSIENISGNSINGNKNAVIKKSKEEKETIKKWKNSKAVFSDSSAVKAIFELPRQQEQPDNNDPEIMGFKASHQLLNPNPQPSSSIRPPQRQQRQQLLLGSQDHISPKRPRLIPRYSILPRRGVPNPYQHIPGFIPLPQTATTSRLTTPRQGVASRTTVTVVRPSASASPAAIRPSSSVCPSASASPAAIRPSASSAAVVGSHAHETPKILNRRHKNTTTNTKNVGNDEQAVAEVVQELPGIPQDIKAVFDSLALRMKRIESENAVLRKNFTDLSGKYDDMEKALTETKEKLQLLDTKFHNKREKALTKIKFIPTPPLISSTFDVIFKRLQYTFKFRDYLQNDMFGKPIEEVCKVMAIRAFESNLPQYYLPRNVRRRSEWEYNPTVFITPQSLNKPQNVPNFADFEHIIGDFDTPLEEENLFDENTVVQLIGQSGGVCDKEWQQTLVTTFVVKENTSDAGIERLETLFKAFIGEQFLVTKLDICRQKKLWLAPFQIKEIILCTRKDCYKAVANMLKKCPCGSDRSERAIITTASITPHLMQILKTNEDELLSGRQPSEKRGDLVDFMTSTVNTNELILELMINSDGVVPKSNSRKPFHPIFLMVKNLPSAKRSSIKNMLLAGIISGVKAPDEQIWKLALDPLYHELQKLKDGIVYKCKNGTEITIKAKVTDAILDQIAAAMLYQLASHMSYGFACTNCETFPHREDRGQRWPLSSGPLRQSNHGIGLPTGDTAFSRIAPPSTYRIDGLHVLDEGLCKTLIYYLQNNFKVMETIKIDINRALLKNGNNSLAYATTLKTLNAHELRLFFTIAIPLLATAEDGNIKVQAAFLFWHLCRLIYSKFLNIQIIEDIAPLFKLLGEVFEKEFGSLFKTIKGHRFFSHEGQELKEFGTPADFSTAACEAGNKDLKDRISAQNTRGFDRGLLPRHILNTVVNHHMEDMVNRCGLPAGTYKELYESKQKQLMSQSHVFDGELLPLMEQNDMTFHSVYRSGFCFKFNHKDERFSYCKAIVNGVGECYKILVGIEREGQKFVLCKKLNVYNPVNYNTFASELKEISTVLSKYQSLVFGIEKESEDYVLIPLKNILAFLLLVEFQSKLFLFDISERYNKT